MKSYSTVVFSVHGQSKHDCLPSDLIENELLDVVSDCPNDCYRTEFDATIAFSELLQNPVVEFESFLPAEIRRDVS